TACLSGASAPCQGSLHRAAIHRLEIPYGRFERRISLPSGNAIGTVASIMRYVTMPDDSHVIVCQGLQRFRVTGFLPGGAKCCVFRERLTNGCRPI
ncbi:MAG: hypothetical protein Q8R51_12915, partial [Azonexus sp.]|nr:hypothetical protein [Azonexus sp.]